LEQREVQNLLASPQRGRWKTCAVEGVGLPRLLAPLVIAIG
jgi:hypothetical protein